MNRSLLKIALAIVTLVFLFPNNASAQSALEKDSTAGEASDRGVDKATPVLGVASEKPTDLLAGIWRRADGCQGCQEGPVVPPQPSRPEDSELSGSRAHDAD